MEIFRHYYTASEMTTNVFFKQHMNNFGFCNLDGSKINYAFGYYSPVDIAMRYKLDTKKQTYLYQQSTRHNRVYGGSYCNTISDIGARLSNGSTYFSNFNAGVTYRSTSPATVVFIPLINNGFFINIRALTCGYNTWTTDLQNSEDPRDKTFLVNTPTPSLNTKIYSQQNYTVSAYEAGTGVFNFIGLPPCKTNPNWTYILYTDASYNYNTKRLYNYKLIDYGDGKVLDLPFVSNFIRAYDSPTPAYNEPTYSNINENICSMIKLPYDNGYIDGVYLLTTAPQQLEDATFFSFDGRNFLNVFDNYVLELPPSTT